MKMLHSGITRLQLGTHHSRERRRNSQCRTSLVLGPQVGTHHSRRWPLSRELRSHFRHLCRPRLALGPLSRELLSLRPLSRKPLSRELRSLRPLSRKPLSREQPLSQHRRLPSSHLTCHFGKPYHPPPPQGRRSQLSKPRRSRRELVAHSQHRRLHRRTCKLSDPRRPRQELGPLRQHRWLRNRRRPRWELGPLLHHRRLHSRR